MNYEDMSDLQVSFEVMCRHLKPVEKKIENGAALYRTHEEERWHTFDINNPNDAWPIVFENKIAMEWFTSDLWRAQCDNQFQPGEFKVWTSYCYKPLRAAMICFLEMKDADK